MARRPSKTVHVHARTLDDVANIIQDVQWGYKGLFAMETAKALVVYLSASTPQYTYISRAAAYPNAPYKPGYFSRKQFRFVMAAIAEGRITPGMPHRSGATENGWAVKGQGTRATIVNNAAGATWTMHPYWQARQPAMVGWQKADFVISRNIDDAMVDGIDAVLEEIGRKSMA